MTSQSISVIIPTKNRASDLKLTLESVIQQSLQPDEIVIVDQSTANKTASTVKNLIQELNIQPNIIYIHDKKISGLSQAKNKGLKFCNGSHNLFLDDDVTLQPDYLETCLAIMEKAKWLDGIAGYRIVPGEHDLSFKVFWLRLFYLGPFRYYYKTMRVMSLGPKLKKTNALFRLKVIGGGWYLIKREVFENFKFDENLIGPSIGEDQDFFIRASTKFTFAVTLDTYVMHRKSTANAYYINRVKNRDHHECKMLSMGYLYKKNLYDNFLNKLCYSWLCIGLFLDAVRSSLFALSFDPVKGALIGLYKVLDGFKDAPMIVKSLREL